MIRPRFRTWILSLAVLLATGSALGDVVRFSEDFSSLPTRTGWRRLGEESLFQWNRELARMEVTWDSSRSNSFLVQNLPRPVTQVDDFAFAFDLVLDRHAVGVNPLRPSTFQIAAGFVRLSAVTATNYLRGALPGPRDTVEWAWFGAADPIAASISPVIIPTGGRLPWAYADSYVPLETGVNYRFELAYTASDRTARLRMRVDGQPGPALESLVLPSNFAGFQVDAFAISSYSEEGQHPLFGGSVLASGRIDNVLLTVPDSPVGRLRWLNDQVRFQATGGWRYELQASSDLESWSPVATESPAADGELGMSDPRDAVFGHQFYRVRATRL